MGNNLVVIVMSLVTLLSFIYSYTTKEFNNIHEKNSNFASFDSNFLPVKYIINENYDVSCIIWKPTRSALKDKNNSIIYFINGSSDLTFNCNSPFYYELGYYRSKDISKICKEESLVDSDISSDWWNKIECIPWSRIEELYLRFNHQCIITDTLEWKKKYNCSEKNYYGSMVDWVCSDEFWNIEFWCSVINE